MIKLPRLKMRYFKVISLLLPQFQYYLGLKWSVLYYWFLNNQDISYCAQGLLQETNNDSDFRQEQTAIPQYSIFSLQFYAYMLTTLIR